MPQGTLFCDTDMIKNPWGPEISSKITEIPLGGSYIPCWRDLPAGTCSFKAIYQLVVQRSIAPPLTMEDPVEPENPPKAQNFHLERPFQFSPDPSQAV